MTIGLSTTLRSNRLQVFLETVDHASDEYDSAHLFIYSGDRPVTGGAVDEYDNTLLLDFLFPFPCGSISNGILTFGTIEDVYGLSAGVPSWARIVDADENFVADLSVTNLIGNGDVKLDSLTLEIFVGGLVKCTVATMTEGNI